MGHNALTGFNDCSLQEVAVGERAHIGLPTFAYTYEEAVTHTPPYLCNFQVMKVQTRFQMEGISKRTISLEDQKKLILQGKDVEEINFEGSQLEKQVISAGTNTLIVREFTHVTAGAK